MARLRSEPQVRLERGSAIEEVRLVPEESMRETVNQRMSEKYGWADDFVGMLGDRSVSLPYRVEPAPRASN